MIGANVSVFSIGKAVGSGPKNLAPVITSSPVTTATETVAYSYQVQATDPEGGSLTYTLPTKPTGMTISGSGLIQWTPSSSGSESVVVRVTDNKGAFAEQSYSIAVAVRPNAQLTYAVVGGGANGGPGNGNYGGSGGGGAGVYRTGSATSSPAQVYTVVVGAAEASSSFVGGSINVTSGTGGRGAPSGGAPGYAGDGGGGGGGGWNGYTGSPGGGSGVYGYSGGSAYQNGGGGGGGMGGNGGSSVNNWYGGTGGVGVTCSVSGDQIAGGGAGGAHNITSGTASHGGGASNGASGTANTGGGGAGNGGSAGFMAAGGSGVVYIKSDYQATSTSGSPTETSVSGGFLYKFTGSGTITF
jgi:hypothetical protein